MKRFVVLAAGLAASAGFAQPPASAPAATQADSYDPNEMICRRVQALGSRLNAGRVCMTRQQWEQRRQADREDAERAQTRRIVPR
jgi:predicted secreted protein